jgi:hypothetical protein
MIVAPRGAVSPTEPMPGTNRAREFRASDVGYANVTAPGTQGKIRRLGRPGLGRFPIRPCAGAARRRDHRYTGSTIAGCGRLGGPSYRYAQLSVWRLWSRPRTWVEPGKPRCRLLAAAEESHKTPPVTGVAVVDVSLDRIRREEDCADFRPKAPRSRLQVQLGLERPDVPV